MWTTTLRYNSSSEELGSFKKLKGIEEPCFLILWMKMRMKQKNALNEDVHDMEVKVNAVLYFLYVYIYI